MPVRPPALIALVLATFCTEGLFDFDRSGVFVLRCIFRFSFLLTLQRLLAPLCGAAVVFQMVRAGAEDPAAAADDVLCFLLGLVNVDVRQQRVNLVHLVVVVEELMSIHVLAIGEAFATRTADYDLGGIVIFHFFVGGHGGRP